MLYESPFTDMNPSVWRAFFGDSEVAEIISILDEINKRAATDRHDKTIVEHKVLRADGEVR